LLQPCRQLLCCQDLLESNSAQTHVH
jgi:hypothetical protein